MNDKERILFHLIEELIASKVMFSDKLKLVSSFGGKNLKKGQLVYCVTSGRYGAHPWQVAWIHDIVSENGGAFGSQELMLREIGSNKLCSMSNESFYVLDGLSPTSLLEGEKQKLYEKMKKVFSQYGDAFHLFSGIEFDDENERVKIKVRQRHSESTYDLCLHLPKWGKRISMKSIAARLEAEGWMVKEFSKKEAS